MPQLTIIKPDNSLVEVLIISESLYKELIEASLDFELEHINLSCLKETQARALYLTSKKVQGKKQEELKDLASSYLDWFDELLDVIVRIENLENPDSLCIYLSK